MLKILKIIGFIIGLLLLLDGIFCLVQNKIHLGTLLPLLIGIVICLHIVFHHVIQDFFKQHSTLHTLYQSTCAIFGLWLISLLIFFAYLHHNKQANIIHPPIQAIIVLGSGIIQGQASPTLKARLDQAGQLAQHSPNAVIIVSGGLDHHEQVSEAKVMADYLQQHFALATARIYLEDQSTSTALNLLNSQAILKQKNISLNQPIAIISSDFHLPRAKAIASKQGYRQLMMIAADTPLATRYNAWLREYFAYLSGWLLNEYDLF